MTAIGWVLSRRSSTGRIRSAPPLAVGGAQEVLCRSLDRAALVLSGEHHRGAHLAVLAEALQQPLEVFHRRGADLQHRAVVAAELVDLDDFRIVAGLAGLQQTMV